MEKFTRWIAGGLGWAFFGPIGGVLGFVIGSFIDSGTGLKIIEPEKRTTTGDFAVSLLVLVAAIMKADGKVLKSELDYVKKYFSQVFGERSAGEAIMLLRDILKQDINLKDVSYQIRDKLDYPSRLQMLHFLYGVSKADGSVQKSELELLILISGFLGINPKDNESIKAMFVEDIHGAYKILEIEPTASIEEIKKAYRTMAVKYHPDKVAYLGEDFKKAANEKFQKVNEAYTKIKKDRGIN
jgi:DnaJ like chaperone protein